MNKISYEERVKVYADALDTFGAATQLVVALEELSEVQKEICKALRGEADPGHLAEEVADATIMLEQVRQMFGINDLVCETMDGKVVWLLQRIVEKKHRLHTDLDRIMQVFGITDEEKTESGILEE